MGNTSPPQSVEMGRRKWRIQYAGTVNFRFLEDGEGTHADLNFEIEAVGGGGIVVG